MVSDIGGKTMDVALLKNSRPAMDPMVEQVSPYRSYHGRSGGDAYHGLWRGL